MAKNEDKKLKKLVKKLKKLPGVEVQATRIRREDFDDTVENLLDNVFSTESISNKNNPLFPGAKIKFKVPFISVNKLVDKATGNTLMSNLRRPVSKELISYLNNGKGVFVEKLEKPFIYKCGATDCPEDHEADSVIAFPEIGKEFYTMAIELYTKDVQQEEVSEKVSQSPEEPKEK